MTAFCLTGTEVEIKYYKEYLIYERREIALKNSFTN